MDRDQWLKLCIWCYQQGFRDAKFILNSTEPKTQHMEEKMQKMIIEMEKKKND